MMKRAQIVVDGPLLERAKHLARREGVSLSALVREALESRLAAGEVDVSWMGSLKVLPEPSHDWRAIERSIEQGLGGARARPRGR